jgi:CBS domain-containing protein
MNVMIDDLMVERVLTAQPHHTVGHVRRLMERNRVHAIPVVDPEGKPVGIASSADLARELREGTPISKVMTEPVYVVPQYNDVQIAARMMRKHRIHHLVVTHEKKMVGILSSLDLLKLVEDRRFAPKASTPPRRKTKRA